VVIEGSDLQLAGDSVTAAVPFLVSRLPEFDWFVVSETSFFRVFLSCSCRYVETMKRKWSVEMERRCRNRGKLVIYVPDGWGRTYRNSIGLRFQLMLARIEARADRAEEGEL